MIGRARTRSRSPWRINILNLILLFVLLAPAYRVLVDYTLAQNQVFEQPAQRYYVPPGLAGIGKVLQEPGITFHGKADMNVMVLGIDLNWTDETHLPYSKGARSDTMFVLHLTKDGSRVGMLTIPRDEYIDLPDHNGHDKINGAYSIGGWQLTKKTLEQFLGIHIDHYLVLRIAGAKKLVDALGGMDLDVEKNMDYDDNWGDLHVHLKKGFQHLNGTQTVAYARFRHDEESDFGRIRRQQQVVDILIKMLKKPENYDNPKKLQRLAGLFKAYVETDLNVPQMLDLAWQYKNFDRQNFVKGFIPGNDSFVGDMSVLLPPDRATIRKVVHKVLGNSVGLNPGDVTVEVINGSHVLMAATALGNKLTQRGFNVVRLADYSGTPPATSMVVVHRDAVVVDDDASPSPAPAGSGSPDASPSVSPSAESSASASPAASPSVSPQDRALRAMNAMAAKLVPTLPVVQDDEVPDLATQNTPKGTMITIILGPDWQNPIAASGSPLPSEVPRATVTVLPDSSASP